MNLLELNLNRLKWEILFLKFKITGKKITLNSYFGKPILNAEQGNQRVKELLQGQEAVAICRMGYNELITTVECIRAELQGKKTISNRTIELMCNNAGFFPPTSDKLMEFSHLMRDVLCDVDLLGVWNNKQEDLVVKEYMAHTELCELRGLEPYYFGDAWSKALEGKKVLVIHPFANSIGHQFKQREKIYPNNILPKFTLITRRAIQTAAGEKDSRFLDWFEALDYMYTEAMKIDFDIAIIGCGAYGLPLAVKLKRAGKKAIHMGGATQILFGIKGKRWDNHPIISKLYNDSWIRPLDDERPQGSKNVENGCYW
ncbi:hypothetical protein ACTM96_04755 [Mediterraneibacter faecis]|uniref:hypothetical protein n=1 Tax=Mediterraneibacter faecis TaxID=592978 RepID=UPI003F8A3CC2